MIYIVGSSQDDRIFGTTTNKEVAEGACAIYNEHYGWEVALVSEHPDGVFDDGFGVRYSAVESSVL